MVKNLQKPQNLADLVTDEAKVTGCDGLPVLNWRRFWLTRQTPTTRHYPSPVTNEIQSTLSTPGSTPREGAEWLPDRCVWKWRHWIMRTPASIELERAMLHSKVMALPELHPSPALLKGL